MEIIMKSIGERIRNRRKELHLTQTDIRAACGISSGALSEIENGTGHHQSSRSMHYPKCFSVLWIG